MIDISIRPRLLWFAERVRKNVTFADIGTDHAKLPVYLVKKGIIKEAIASDIGEGPIARARMYISVNGLDGVIKTCVGDGVSHLELAPPADIAICGMGGETIINIVDAAPLLKQRGMRLLLQPMTDFAALRIFLAENGFEPIDEEIVFSDEKMYQCMVAEYTGRSYVLSVAEAEFGTICIKNRSQTFLEYVSRRYENMKKRFESKSKAGHDVSEEIMLINAYENILNGEK